MELGKVLKIFRIANEMDAKTAAREIECSSSYITEVEKGNKNPSVSMFEKMAKVYKVKPYQIMRVQENSEENDWSYAKTLLEALKECIKANPEDA